MTRPRCTCPGAPFACVPGPLGKDDIQVDITTMMRMLGEGFIASLQIFALTLVGALPLGVVVVALRMCRFAPVRLIARAYISVMRGTPLMLQMFAIYFMPFYVFGVQLTPSSKWQAAIFAFIVNYAAYFAEIYRSGLQSIPRGQYEAAEVLGYSKFQTLVHIVVPQVVKRIMPAIGNEVITLVKDTSLAFAIGVGGDVLHGKGARRLAGEHGSVRHRGCHLLDVQLCGGARARLHREAPHLLSRFVGSP